MHHLRLYMGAPTGFVISTKAQHGIPSLRMLLIRLASDTTPGSTSCSSETLSPRKKIVRIYYAVHLALPSKHDEQSHLLDDDMLEVCLPSVKRI